MKVFLKKFIMQPLPLNHNTPPLHAVQTARGRRIPSARCSTGTEAVRQHL